MPSIRFLRLGVFVILALGFAGCGEPENPDAASSGGVPREDRPNLSFYYIPECFLCLELRNELTALQERFGDRINFGEYDYHLQMSQQGIARFQLGTHGIVIHDNQGNELWTLKAHEEKDGEVARAIEQLLLNGIAPKTPSSHTAIRED